MGCKGFLTYPKTGCALVICLFVFLHFYPSSREDAAAKLIMWDDKPSLASEFSSAKILVVALNLVHLYLLLVCGLTSRVKYRKAPYLRKLQNDEGPYGTRNSRRRNNAPKHPATLPTANIYIRIFLI